MWTEPPGPAELIPDLSLSLSPWGQAARAGHSPRCNLGMRMAPTEAARGQQDRREVPNWALTLGKGVADTIDFDGHYWRGLGQAAVTRRQGPGRLEG